MNILYVCRLYSGFEESIKTGIWNPKGAPTIARMIEHLDNSSDHDLTIILTQKGKGNNPSRQVKVEGLSKPVTIIAGQDMFPGWLWKFQEKFSDIYQLVQILYTYSKLKPDIVYCDRVNIIPAAFLSRFTKAKVIWRVMGVLQDMHEASMQNTLRANFRKYLWCSPFKAVICTLDGSGGGPWLKKVLNPLTPSHLLINGIKKDQISDTSITLPNNCTKALFVGRLENLKGIEEFMDAFYEAAKSNDNLHAIIAGDGSLKETMIGQAKEYDMQARVHFLGSITPNQLKHVRQNCSFYISLNKQGNLSNVNLEALYDELPTIIPSSQPEKGIDIDTDNFVPKDVFYRFGEVGDKNALVKAIKYMANDKNRANFKKNMKLCAENLLPSWQERIDQELRIFADVVKIYDFAIVIADLGSGGAQKVATSLIKDLNKQGYKIAIITLSNDNNDFFTLPNNVKRIALNEQRDSNNIINSITSNTKRIITLRRALKYLSPQKTVSFIAPVNILTIIASAGLNTQTIISERNDPSRQSFGKFWDGLRIILYRFATIVTANSLNAINTLKKYVPEEKLNFIPNALPRPDSKYIIPHSDKEKIILIVGRLHPQKAHNILLKAFAISLKKHPKWSLVIAGEGLLRKNLEKQVSDLGLENNVIFKGAVNNPYELYAKASIFAMPSLHEGMPNALLEAMSCGIAPIISDACEGAMPYIINNESGLIAAVNNINSLANALNKMMDNKDFRQKIGYSALKKVTPLHEKTTIDMWHDILIKDMKK